MKNLPRTLIYRDRKELDEFLKDNELNNMLYDVFLVVKDSYYNLKISAEAIFNEVYYQCTRLMLDPHPEARVWDYLNDAKDNTGWRYTSDLVFSMVYAVLSLQQEVNLPIQRFLRILKGKNLNQCYFPYFEDMVVGMSGLDYEGEVYEEPKRFKSDFTPCPEPPERLSAYKPFIWSEVTNDYDQEQIRLVVNLWSKKEDKITVLKMIEDAFDFDEAFKGKQTYSLINGVNDDMELPF